MGCIVVFSKALVDVLAIGIGIGIAIAIAIVIAIVIPIAISCNYTRGVFGSI